MNSQDVLKWGCVSLPELALYAKYDDMICMSMLKSIEERWRNWSREIIDEIVDAAIKDLGCISGLACMACRLNLNFF